MIILEERLTEKVKHRKQITIKVIIHYSTVGKITEDDLVDFISDLSEFRTESDEKKSGYLTIRKLWDKTLKDIPKVKIDNRFKLGVYLVFKKFYLKVRNPDRFKTQVIELCYID